MANRRMSTPNNSNQYSVSGIINNGGYNSKMPMTISSLEIADEEDDNNDHHESRLGKDETNKTSSLSSSSSSIDEKYRTEREQAKLRNWKESEHAAGLVEPTWGNELEAYRKKGCCCPDREAMVHNMFQEEIDPGCGCIYLSALICSRIGAGRIGNMAVLKERYVMVEAEDDDNEDNDEDEQERVDGFVVDDDEEGFTIHQHSNSNNARGTTTKKSTKAKQLVRKREIQLVVGPFWPMLVFITYPLIFGVSAFTLYSGLPGKPLYVQIVWALLTLQLIRSLFNTGFRDPGILQRHTKPPRAKDVSDNDLATRSIGFRWGNENGQWRWSDQAQSYRPKNSMYCPDCKVIVEEFDHT